MAKVTSVEKFKEYREEIIKQFSNDEVSTKRKTSDHINKVRQDNSVPQIGYNVAGNTMTLDEILKAHEIYEDSEEEIISPLAEKQKKDKAIKIIGLILTGILAIGVLVTGILYFGGFVKWKES